MEYEKGSIYSHLTISGALKASLPFDSISSDRKSRCLYCVKSLVMVVVASACCLTEVFKALASVVDILVWAERVAENRKMIATTKLFRKTAVLRFPPPNLILAPNKAKES